MPKPKIIKTLFLGIAFSLPLHAAEYNMRVAANGVQSPIYESCKEILEKEENSVSGTYTIKSNLKEIPVYCDMVSDGGGWTFILGVGTEFNRTHSFWDGVNPGDGKTTSLNGFSMSTESSAHLIKNLSFKEIKLTDNSSSENFTSNTMSSFSTKKKNATPFGVLRWNYNGNGGYTDVSYLLASVGDYDGNQDYRTKGIALSGKASSRATTYGTAHNRLTGRVDCGNSEGCLYRNNYSSSASLGYSTHRYVSGVTITGLFFR